MKNIHFSGQKQKNSKSFYFSVVVRDIDFMHEDIFKNTEYQINMIIQRRESFSSKDIFFTVIPAENKNIDEREKEAQKVIKYFLSRYDISKVERLKKMLRTNPLIEIDGAKYAGRLLYD